MKDTIEMAREAGIPALGDIHLELTDLKAFAELVRADERDLCAQVVWEMKGQCWAYDHDTIAAAIRARGTHEQSNSN
jgi:hypothetical protein